MTNLQLEIFLQIHETGSFTKAAEKLNMTQSAVSHSIAALEKELGLPLFERGNKTVKMTMSGFQILPHVREVFNQQAIIRQKVNALLDCETGKVQIGSFPSFMARLLPGLIKEYKENFPGIELQVYEGDYNDIQEWVKEGVIDFGISIDSGDSEFIPLMQDPMHVVLPSSHPLQQLRELGIEDIAAEPYINVKGYEKLLEEIMLGRQVKLSISCHLHNTYSIISAVEAGLGVTLLPELALPEYGGNFCSKLLHPPFNRTVGILVRSVSTLTPAAKSLIDFITARVESKPG